MINISITDNKKTDLGVSLYKIATYYNLNKNQTRRLIQKRYNKSKFSGSFDNYYNDLLLKVNSNFNPLTITEFYKALNDMNISNSNYHNLKQNYYTKTFVYHKMMYNALNHIKYKNERIEKEIVGSMGDKLNY